MPAAARIRLLVALVCACAFGGLAVAVAPADAAKNCGKQVIDEYFFSGRIKYHPQECYASALKQIDPDARMYSGIMGAIRAARARDRAKDAQAASGGETTDGGGSVAPSDGGAPSDPTDSATPIEPIEPLPIDIPAEEPVAPDLPLDETEAVAVVAGEAAPPVPTVDGVVPLPVAILMGLAGLVTLVGLGGLTVRWLDGPR